MMHVTLLALSLWLLAFTAALFVLATEVWQGAPLWYFVGAVLLGVLEPLGTWIIVKRYPETDWLAWLLLWIMAGIVATLALLRLWARKVQFFKVLNRKFVVYYR